MNFFCIYPFAVCITDWDRVKGVLKAIIYILSAVGAAMTFVVGISPDEARSNVAGWLRLVGVEEVPKWLGDPAADSWFLVLGPTMLAVALVAYILRRSRHQERVPISKAIDYIVHHSTADLDRPLTNRPEDQEKRPPGYQYFVAVHQINERANAGDITLWGHRERLPRAKPPNFENHARPIELAYWSHAELDWWMPLFETRSEPQTRVTGDGDHATPTYTNLTIPTADLYRAWPRKSLRARIAQRLRRNHTIPLEQVRRPSSEPLPDLPKAPSFAPQIDWIPIAEAPFRLAQLPQFASSFWSPESLGQFLSNGHVDKPPIDQRMKHNPSLPQWRTDNGSELTFCGVDLEKQRFGWQWTEPNEKRDKRFGYTLSPWDVPEMSFKRISEEQQKAIKGKAAFVWQLMTEAMDALIEDGSVRLWARQGSATAPFAVLSHDSWRHFDVADWPTGYATTKDGEKLFSIHIEVLP